MNPFDKPQMQLIRRPVSPLAIVASLEVLRPEARYDLFFGRLDTAEVDPYLLLAHRRVHPAISSPFA